MSDQGGQIVMDRWVEDPAFREQLRKDPDSAVKSIGADLDEKQLEILHSLDWTLSDEELQALLEKAWGGYC